MIRKRGTIGGAEIRASNHTFQQEAHGRRQMVVCRQPVSWLLPSQRQELL